MGQCYNYKRGLRQGNLLVVRKIQVAQPGQLLDGHLSDLVARRLERLERRKLCHGQDAGSHWSECRSEGVRSFGHLLERIEHPQLVQ